MTTVSTGPERPLPTGVTIRPHNDGDDEAVASLMTRTNPDYPETSTDEYRRMIASTPVGIALARFVAERDGAVVAAGGVIQKFWVAESGSFGLNLDVDERHRREGIGSALFSASLDFARKNGAARLFIDVHEDRPGARDFAKHREFTETGHTLRMSRLRVSEATYENYDGLEDRLRGEGIEIRTLSELGADDESVLRRWHAVDMKTAQDEPSSETFSMPFEVYRDTLFKQPGVSPEAMWAAVHDRAIVGVTKVRRQGKRSGWHDGMGVLREYRGRGVARLLKLRTIQWSAANGVEYLYTGNDVNNPRMFAINERLGYRPLPRSIEMVRDL